ncbi:hypothetical protein NEOLEDRAFT_1141729 [Neolentinus lepideus HHB14362 ss-1]|uniref:Uncharacterized protein n=1 Tax=Neolentinus lepideus HHB14362 ss-1 TaxID=1314782 RepID=A0A165NJA0_9AGAM|nr:hypothetical protein NEOLEDRAFT_1141729 [Neolentinus lepideus HHB14362 ss-1]
MSHVEVNLGLGLASILPASGQPVVIAGEKGPTLDQKPDDRVEEAPDLRTDTQPTQSTYADTEKGWDPNLVTWYGPDDP